MEGTGLQGHVIFGGFDGDEGAYQRLADGILDADGVQNIFYEVDLTFKALEDMWAGQKPEKLLLDPGFVITQQNLAQKRDDMWGYTVRNSTRADSASGTSNRSGTRQDNMLIINCFVLSF